MLELTCIMYAGRRITVIDGQPFYESSGINSGVAGLWLPFVMVLEDFKLLCDADGAYKSIHIPDKLYGPYIRRRLIENEGGNAEAEASTIGYLLVYNADVAHPGLTDTLSPRKLDALHPGLSNYLTLKNHAVTSMRLGSSFWEGIAPLQLQELLDISADELPLLKPFYLPGEASVEIESPSELNAWLLAQGARDIAGIFCCSEAMANNAAEYLTYKLDIFITQTLKTLAETGNEGEHIAPNFFAQNNTRNIQTKVITELMRYHNKLKNWITQEAEKGSETAHEYIQSLMRCFRLVDKVIDHTLDFSEQGLETLRTMLQELLDNIPQSAKKHLAHPEDQDRKILSIYRAELMATMDIMGFEVQDKQTNSGKFESILHALTELYIDSQYAQTQRDFDAISMQLHQLTQSRPFLKSYATTIPTFEEICARELQQPEAQPKI